MALRRAVHSKGLRYFVNRRPIPSLRRTADLVFPRARVAVYLDGCFWHGCPLHHKSPTTNSDYWTAKITRNRERDAQTDDLLLAAGWRAVRVWEHEDPEDGARLVAEAVATATL